ASAALTRSTADGATLGVFLDERLAALVTAATSAATVRGVRVGSTVGQLLDRYPEAHGTKDAVVDGVRVDVYRYDGLGVGFEVRGGRVARVTLYPPAAD
ncbi:MAG: hypothetical protein ACRC33_16085, partial [Gemmataceae bacterium]